MKGKEAALDTCILIDYFNDDSSIDQRLVQLDILYIPIPVIAEMEFGYPIIKNSKQKRNQFDAFLDRVDVKLIDCDRIVAGHFAEIKRHLRTNGSMIPVNDIWIAACCIAHNKKLATRDSDFMRVPGLDVAMW